MSVDLELPIPEKLKMIIFDLDDTLRGNYQRYNLDPHIIDTLNYLKNNNIIIGIDTLNPWASFLLQEYNVNDLFTYVCCNDFNIENDDKTQMLLFMMEKSGIPPENILYFDDGQMQCDRAEKVNIKYILVKPLLQWDDIKRGFDLF